AAGLGVSGCDPGSSSSATGSPPPSPTPSASSASAMGSSASPSSTLVSPTSDELPSLASSEKPVSDPLSPVSLPSSRVADCSSPADSSATALGFSLWADATSSRSALPLEHASAVNAPNAKAITAFFELVPSHFILRIYQPVSSLQGRR